MRISGPVAAGNLMREGPRARYPDRSSPRGQGPMLLPELQPSFALTPGEKIFTIGSCFARNIESRLPGFEIPMRKFSAPKSELPAAQPNAILNEYNAGTIAQRIARAVRGEPAPPETIVPHEDKVIDLLLHGWRASPVTEERAFERRREIDAIYAELPSSDVVIMTLGLVEAWYDRELDTYLNRMPSRPAIATGRYDLVVMSVDDALALLEPAFRLLAGKRIIVTVSPVPLGATFSGNDAVVSNSYSKAVLRVCAEQLAQLPGVDYFPSFEMATSAGPAAYVDDNIHVKIEIVEQIVAYMLEGYMPADAAAAAV